MSDAQNQATQDFEIWWESTGSQFPIASIKGLAAIAWHSATVHAMDKLLRKPEPSATEHSKADAS